MSLVRERGSVTAHLPATRIKPAQVLIQVLALIIPLTHLYYMCAVIVFTQLGSSAITQKAIANEKGLQKQTMGV